MFGVPLHKLIVHFPIALAVVALAYDWWGSYSQNPALHSTGSGLSVMTGVTAAIAAITGLQAAGVTRLDQGAVTVHAALGITSAIVIAAFSLWRYSTESRQEAPHEKYPPFWILIQLLAAILIVSAAVTGHRM